MHDITIYCDGSSIGNPGPGGWGAVISNGRQVKELGGFEADTTNNRMELTAAVESLRALRGASSVTLHTDSSYVINGITKWVRGWLHNDWQTKEKKDVLNKDLWQELIQVTAKHKVVWEHVRGHAGVRLNERVDILANGYARRKETILFSGTEVKYQEFLESMPKARVVRSWSAKNKKAYSYVSSVDGKVMAHTTWVECEKRVKGKKGVKYKKVFSKEEEVSLMSRWRG